MRYGMVIDLKKCVGCNACSVACRQQNATPPGILYSRVYTWEEGQYPNTRLKVLPVLCMHCEEPPCETVCPTGATMKQENGIVTVNPDLCIGCRYCMVACPYNARFFNFSDPEQYFPNMDLTAFEATLKREHVKGTVEKCDFCIERVEAGEVPMCVQTCPAVARYFGDLDDPNSEVSRLIASKGGYTLHPELGTHPSVYYLPG